jgi:hypothetical protein
LGAGELLAYPHNLPGAEGDYLGGVSYVLIDAGVGRVVDLLQDASSYRRILPNTLEARITDRRADTTRVFFRQGGKITSVEYSLWIRRESLSVLRFWIDLEEPHDIDDCWGYFRALPWQRSTTILTYAAFLRLEPGLLKLLFAEKIRAAALRTPLFVREEVRARASRKT